MQKISFTLIVLVLLHTQMQGQGIPKYTAIVGGQEGGSIARGAFLAQQGVGGMRFLAGNHWEPIRIDSFSIVVQRDTAIVFKNKVIGQIFDTKLKERMKEIIKGDRIIICNIYGHGPENIPIFIRPIEFIIE